MNTSLLHSTALGLAILGSLAYGGRASAAGCATPVYPASGVLSAGFQPVDVAVGDFNADGKVDLVVANQFSADVSILLGNGNGTFQPAVNYSAGFGPSSVAVGHLNGDGRLDIVVSDSGTAAIWVLMGNGNGTFQSAVSYAVSDLSQFVVLGDYNLDGKLDVAVALRVINSISVLFGNGNGTFQTPSDYLVGQDPLFIAVGDFNKDGPPDLAVANAALFEDAASSVTLLKGRNTGNFQNGVDFTAGTSPRAIAVGDFNMDSNPDMAVANYGSFPNGVPPFTNSSLSIMLGNGSGGFAAPVNLQVGEGPLSLVATDLNGDGKLDLAVVNYRSSSVSILFGVGNGTFSPAASYNTGANPHSLAVGDFNGDGMPDLVVAIDAGAQVLLSSCVSADMAIGMTGTPSTLTPGQSVTYTMNVTNRGPNPAVSATLTNRIPGGMSFNSFTTSLGSCNNTNGSLSCSFGTMATGATATVTLTMTAVSASTFTNTASVASATIDPIASNSVARVVTAVQNSVSISAPDSTATEAGPTSGFFVISRSGSSSGNLTINYTISGTAANGVDYATIPSSATIADGFSSASITINPVNDTQPEPSETVILTLSPSTNYVVNPSGDSATLTIIDNDVFAVAINDTSVTEGDSGTVQAVFTVTLTPASSQPVTVEYSTANGFAVAGSDYVATNGVVSFPPGTSNQSVIVPVIGDLINEANESFFVNLANVTGAAIIVDGQAQGTILNNDPLPLLSINDVSITEGNSGNSTAVFTVNLSPASGQNVSVAYATSNGTALASSDYAAASGTLSFSPGTTEQIVTVLISGDGLNEANETFFVNLSNPVNAAFADAQGQGTISNDDPVPDLSIDDVTFTEGNSGGANMLFVVRLSAASGQTVSANFATTNGTAIAGSDYTSTNGVVTIAPGTTTQTIPVRITGDTLNESDETLFMNLSGAVNATLTDGQATGTILNNDPLPALSINNVTLSEGDSGTTDATFTVTLSPVSGQTVTVDFATSDITTQPGSDIIATNGTLTFAPGDTSRSIVVKVIGDLFNEPNETFVVNLTGPANATLADEQGLGTINNNDPLPSLSINDVVVTEGDSGTVNASFTVSLSQMSGQTVTFNYATANGTALAGSDYVAASGPMTIPAGTMSQSLTVQVLGDTFNEADEAFFVNLSNPGNATLGDGQGTGTINNNDPLPILSINNVSVKEGDSGITNAVFTVILSAASGRTVTVNYATADGTATDGEDYIGASGMLTFAPGTLTRTVTVQVIGDVTNEVHETYLVNLSGAVNATLGDSSGLGTIFEDDAPSISIGSVSVSEGNAGTTNAVFELSLSFPSPNPVSIDFSTANGTAAGGSDYVATNGTVNFDPGMTNQTLIVRVNGDVLSESNEFFFVNLSDPTNTIIGNGQGVGTIIDEDPFPTVSILNVSVNEGNAGTANAVFTVHLSPASGQEVTVDYETADGMAIAGADYIATNGTVTFPPGSTDQFVTVPILGDSMNESNETFFVNLSSPFRATLGDSQAVGTITDNDPVAGILISDTAVFEGNSGTVNMVFTLSLSAVSGQAISVTYATADGTASRQQDYVRIVTAVAQFSPGQTNQTIAVVVNGDTQNEANETLFVNLSNPVNATLLDTQAQGTILNDEGVPSLSISDATVTEGNSGVVNAVFNVRLSASHSQVVNVGYSTADGTATAGADYVGTNGIVSFPVGTTNQTITVAVLGELVNEVNETFFVNLAFTTNAPITDGQGVGTISNDDGLPTLAIDDVTVTEAPPGTTNAVFTVSLSPASAQTVTVNYATADGTAAAGSDYVSTNGVLSFAPGVTTRTLSVPVIGDMENEPAETFFVNLSAPANATLGDNQGVGTILNGASVPAVTISDVTVTEGNSGSASAVFTVNLSFSFDQQVTVNFSTANGTAVAGSDYIATNGILSFAPGVTNRSVPVAVLGDSLNESNEVFFLNLSNPTNAFFSDSQGVGTISNDDPLPSLTISDVSVAEGNSGTTNATFTVTLSAASGQTVTVNFTTADSGATAGSDYASTNGSLTFAPGVTTRTITVSVNGDAITESDETFLVNLSGAVNATLGDGQGVGMILNDDTLPSVSIGNVTLSEGNTGPANALFTVSLSSTYPQTVTVSYATANGTATAGSDYTATNGAVTFAPGSTNQTITVRVLGDTLNEPNETFFVNLSNPTNATIADGQGLGTINNDDALPSLSIGDDTLAEGDSGTSDASFTVTLSAVSSQTVTVNFATANGTATAGSDYVATNGVLSFAPGVTNQTVIVRVNGDLLGESNETFVVNLSNPGNATLADGQGLGTIIDDESLPVLNIGDVTVSEGNAGVTNAVFNVRLSLPFAEVVSVHFATADGTAVAGSDYVATNGVLTFDPGTTNQTITVAVLGDVNNELNETLFVNLSNPTNAAVADDEGLGLITNDDPLPSLSINNATVTEGNSGTTNATFTITLSPVSGQTVTVNYTTANGDATAGSDYVATNGVLTFAPGTATQTLSVMVNGDLLNEPDETFFVNLSGPANALLSDGQGVGTISNNDSLPTLSINDATVTEGNTGTTNAVFTVTLSAASGQTVTVNFSTADGTASSGSDYASTNGSLTFPSGTTTRTITVRVNGDLLTEINETFSVNLVSPAGATLSDGQGLGTIVNDDPPAISINDVTVTEGNSGTANAVFTVSLSGASGQACSVNFATADGTALAGSDYFSTNGTLNFAPGTATQTVTVRIIGDTVFENNETFFVNLSNPIGATIVDNQGTGTINDNDPLPALFINDVAVTEGDSGSINATFSVRLSVFSSQPVSVDFATANGTAIAGLDYDVNGGTLTFAPGSTNQTIVVEVFGDLSNESNETYFVNLSNPTGATISDGQGVGTINNDDPLPAISIGDAAAFEGNSGTTSIVFTVSLSAASGQQVSVNYATADGTASRQSDYTRINNTPLVFSPGQTNQTISVVVSGDTTVEGNETFTVDLATPVNATLADNQAVGTILNDDGIPSVFINDPTVAEGNSGTANLVFNVRLSTNFAQVVTVAFSTADGTAVAGADYLGTNGVLTFPANNTNQTITVRVVGDILNEVNETLFVNLTGSTNAFIGDGQGVGTINNDDPLPALFVDDMSTMEGDEGTVTATFSVRLSPPSGRAVSVNFATANVTALAALDYLATNGTLVFPPGATNQFLEVAILGDVLNEAAETFAVDLSTPFNATIGDGHAAGTILNDDPLPALSIGNVSLVEGNSGTTNASFTVSLSAVSGQTVSVDYATSDGNASAGADYTATNGTLSFPPGTLTRTITVEVHADLLNEAAESFVVGLFNAVNATFSGSSGIGTILNDDPLPALSIGDATVAEGDSGVTNALFTVSLSVASGQNVTVNFATSDGTALAGSDYVGTNGSLSFSPGVTSRTIAVPVLGDVFNEANETFSVTLSSPVNATLSDGQAVGTIINEDPLPALLISDVTVTEGDNGSVDAVFTVSLSVLSGQAVTVNYATTDGTALAGSDYISTNGTVNLAPGTASQAITVKVIGDTLNELDETFQVLLSNPGNATLGDGSGVGTIVNNDPLPTVSLSDASVAEGNSGATAMLFTVHLSAASGRPVTVNYATANATALAGTDYVATNGSISLAAGTTNQTIAVMVLGDTLDEVNESFNLSLSSPINATLGDGLGVGTINDDDPVPALTVHDITITEGNGGAAQTAFVVSLSTASGRSVSVGYSMTDGTATSGSDYVATSGSLNFPPGTTTQTVPVTVLGDTLNEADESFFLNLTLPVNASISGGQGVGIISNDDPLPSLAIEDVLVMEGDSGATDAVLVVSLSVVSGQSVSVDYATTNGTALAGTDYIATNGTVSFEPGETVQFITIKVNGDPFNEVSENFFVNLSEPVNVTLADAQGMVTIDNDDPLPTLAIEDVTVTEGNTGTTDALFRVSLSMASGQTVTVDYATADGTAAAGVDYRATNGIVTFAPGTTNQTITVATLGDLLNEPGETFLVTLSNPTNAVLGDFEAIGTIDNNDPPPSLAISDVTVTEGDSGTVDAIFTVSLSTASEQTVVVSYATADGSAVAGADYLATNGVVTFAPGAVSREVRVKVLADALNESAETFFVNLSGAINATLADSQGRATINNDDPLPALAISDMSVSEGDSGTSTLLFNVALSAVSGQTVTFNYATANGSAVAGTDYIATNGLVSIAPGAAAQTIAVRINGDILNESDETFFVNLSNPTNATLGDGQAVGTISNDDPLPSLSINNVSVTEGNNGGTTNAVFTISLSAISGQTVTVSYASSNGTAVAGSDYISTNGTLTFAPGVLTQAVTVQVNGDALSEASETFFVNLTDLANATFVNSQGTGTILDNDPLPSLAISDVTVTESDSGTVDALFTVSLSTASGQTVTVDYATAAGTAAAGADYLATNGTVTFAAGVTSQDIRVKVFGDTLNESNETFFVNLSGAVNATLADGQGLGTINNNDPLPLLSIGDMSRTEGDSGTTTVIFNVGLSTVSGQTVVFNYATANGTAVAGADYIATNGLLSIAPGATAQTIEVRINGDLLNEADETFFVNLSNPTNATLGDGQGVGTITDDDPLPSLSINNVSIAEGNSGTTNAVFTVSLSVASGRTVTVNYASSNGTAIAGSDYISTNGTLTFAPGVITQAVVIRVNGDALSEASETFFVGLSAPTNATLGDSQGLGTIIDNDPLPALFINDVAVTEGNSGVVNALFTVRLGVASGQEVSVNFATSNGTAVAGADFLSTNGTVTFPAGSTNQTLAVAVLGELSFEANETFVVNLSNPANATISDGQGTGTINNDDTAPAIFISDAAGFEGNSGTTNINFTLSLSVVSGLPVTVTYATADGTATRQGDYVRIVGSTVVFNPGQSNQTISVTVNGETVVEPNETFFVDLSNPINATLADSQAQGLILNDDGVPSLFINDATVTEGNTGSTNANFIVRLSAASTQPVTVGFATANGTALAGSDFVATNGTLTFPVGSTNQTLAVRVLGDGINEGTETFFVNLFGSTNALISDGTGLGTIVDNDPLDLLLSTNSLSVPEGGTNFFSIRLNAQPSSNVVVTTLFSSGDASLGVSAGANLVFNAANWNVDQPVVLSAAEDDDIAEGQALFTASAAGLASRTVTARELENDAQSLMVASSQSQGIPPRLLGIQFQGADAVVRFTTVLSNIYRLERSDEVTGAPWTLVADNVMGTGGIVPVTDSGGAGRARRFYRANLATASGVSLVIPEGGTGNFTVRLAAQPTNTVTVTVARTSGSTNLTVAGSGILTFNTENWNVPQTVVVNASEDANTTDDEATLTVSSPGLASQSVSVMSLDNDLQAFIQCPGDTIVLNAMSGGAGPLSYQWRKDGVPLAGQTNASLLLASLLATDAGAYSVQISASSYTLTKTGTLAMNTPTSATGPNSMAHCPGETASFSTAPAGSGPFTYRWRKAGVDVDGATNSSFVLPNVSAADAAEYCVIVSGACNRVTNCASLTVWMPVSATGPPSLTNCPGTVASFVVTARGSGPLTYQWSKDGVVAPGQTSSNLVLLNVGTADVGNYCVVVSGPCNRVTNCASLTILTPLSATGPSGQTVCPGATASFGVSVTGSGPIRFQWSKAGANLPGATNSTLLLPNVGAADAGSYCVVVSGPCNSVTNCASLTLLTPLSATGPFGQTNCPGAPASFSVTATGSGSLGYQWSKAGVDLPGATNNTLLLPGVSALDAGTYCVVVSGPCNRVTNCASLTVLTPVSATGPVGISNCPGTTASFSVAANGSGPLSYQWSKTGVDLPGATNSTLVLPNVSAPDAGNYCVVVSGACNQVSHCANLTVFTPLSASGPVDQTNCADSPVSFSVAASGSGPFTYQWSKAGADLPGATNSTLVLPNIGAQSAGNYCVVVSGPCNRVTNCATLTVLTPVSATGPTDEVHCPGATAILSVAAMGTGPLSYQWSKAGVDLPGATNNTLVLPAVSAASSGTYCVAVGGACNRVTNCATLTVVPPPEIVSQPTNQAVFVENSATFTVNAAGTGALSFQWRFNGADLPGETDSTLIVPSAQPINEGAYTVVVSDSACSVTSAVARLTLLRDFGDAPNPAYPTLLATNGARHLIVPGFHLGARIDAEADGQPTSLADGDDVNGGTDDEDGVTFLTPLVPGLVASVQVVASASGRLDGWVDFEADGSWADPNDRVFMDEPVNAGINLLTFRVPLNAVLTPTFARFRFGSAGGLSFVGEAADGEVEDYRVDIVPLLAPPEELAMAGTTVNSPLLSYAMAGPAILGGKASVTVSWPLPSSGFILESATSLTPANWEPAAEEPVLAGDRWEVRIPVAEPQRYFRLRKL